MSLSRDQVVEVLQKAATFDRRTIGHADVEAWSAAAQIGRWATRTHTAGGEPVWSNSLALAAVENHYATNPAYLMPGHITAWIKNERTKPTDSGALLIEKTPASEETRARVMDEMRRLSNKFAMDGKRGPTPSDDEQEAS